MGDQERSYLRSLRVKFGIIAVVVLSLACYFVWRDWSEGHYLKLILLPFLVRAGGMRTMKGFRRPKAQ